MTKHSPISRDDVLNAFAMDYEPGNNALGQYLADYPQFSADLVDLCRELSREIDEDLPLSPDELAAVSAKMSRLRESTVTLEALHAAPPKVFTEAAKALGLPLQIGVAIRERRIDVTTLPSRVLELFAQDSNQALRRPRVLAQLIMVSGQQARSVSCVSCRWSCRAVNPMTYRVELGTDHFEDIVHGLFGLNESLIELGRRRHNDAGGG